MKTLIISLTVIIAFGLMFNTPALAGDRGGDIATGIAAGVLTGIITSAIVSEMNRPRNEIYLEEPIFRGHRVIIRRRHRSYRRRHSCYTCYRDPYARRNGCHHF